MIRIAYAQWELRATSAPDDESKYDFLGRFRVLAPRTDDTGTFTFFDELDDGTAAAKVGMGILADTQTKILFRQSGDQIPEAVRTLGLTSSESAILLGLARGQALLKAGDNTAIVQHRIGTAEWPICETDGRLPV